MKDNRCPWVKPTNPLYVTYHDQEWGVPSFDELHLFEMLCLEGAQAGLSWETILNKREAYRKLFYQFNPEKMAKMTDKQLEKILLNPSIIRNRLKVYGFRKNAQAYLKMKKEGLTLSEFLWSHVDHRPLQNKIKTMKEIKTKTEISDEISKKLKKMGFTFVGPTIIYAYMQAIGMVNDHLITCPRHKAVRS
ncbi:MAG: DNA-3-methyladenine glycosylase I [Bacteriovoracaceae bacterium]